MKRIWDHTFTYSTILIKSYVNNIGLVYWESILDMIIRIFRSKLEWEQYKNKSEVRNKHRGNQHMRNQLLWVIYAISLKNRGGTWRKRSLNPWTFFSIFYWKCFYFTLLWVLYCLLLSAKPQGQILCICQPTWQ